MGPGSIFVGMVLSTLAPLLLMFPFSYYAMVKGRKPDYGWKRLTAAFFSALLGGGLVYACLCLALGLDTMSSDPVLDASTILLLVIPLFSSVLALWAFKPRPPKG